MFRHHGVYFRHLKTCKEGVSTSYKGGTFKLKSTLFERLEEEEGVIVPVHLHYSTFFSTWDIEVLQAHEEIRTERTSFYRKHRVVSIANCSNVPGFEEPVCFVNETGDAAVIEEFYEYQQTISNAKYEVVKPLYSEYFDQVQSSSLKDLCEQFLRQLNVISFNGKYIGKNATNFSLKSKKGPFCY